jgi:hypothetical protein
MVGNSVMVAVDALAGHAPNTGLTINKAAINRAAVVVCSRQEKIVRNEFTQILPGARTPRAVIGSATQAGCSWAGRA